MWVTYVFIVQPALCMEAFQKSISSTVRECRSSSAQATQVQSWAINNGPARVSSW